MKLTIDPHREPKLRTLGTLNPLPLACSWHRSYVTRGKILPLNLPLPRTDSLFSKILAKDNNLKRLYSKLPRHFAQNTDWWFTKHKHTSHQEQNVIEIYTGPRPCKGDLISLYNAAGSSFVLRTFLAETTRKLHLNQRRCHAFHGKNKNCNPFPKCGKHTFPVTTIFLLY